VECEGNDADMTDSLTPPDCDLRDYPWMPVDCTRLLTSETWIMGSADEKVAALTLWCKSWHQVPAASLPANERMLSVLSEAGAKWQKVRDHALRGWVKCSDGRLYHPVVAEKAVEAWNIKLARKARTEAARAAKSARQTEQRAASVTEPVTGSVTDVVTGSNGTDSTRPDQNIKEERKIERDLPLPRDAGAEPEATTKPEPWAGHDPHPSAVTATVGQVVAKLEGRARGQPFMTPRSAVRTVEEQQTALMPRKPPKVLPPEVLAQLRAQRGSG
jgi:hypothetical protein